MAASPTSAGEWFGSVYRSEKQLNKIFTKRTIYPDLADAANVTSAPLKSVLTSIVSPKVLVGGGKENKEWLQISFIALFTDQCANKSILLLPQ